MSAYDGLTGNVVKDLAFLSEFADGQYVHEAKGIKKEQIMDVIKKAFESIRDYREKTEEDPKIAKMDRLYVNALAGAGAIVRYNNRSMLRIGWLSAKYFDVMKDQYEQLPPKKTSVAAVVSIDELTNQRNRLKPITRRELSDKIDCLKPKKPPIAPLAYINELCQRVKSIGRKSPKSVETWEQAMRASKSSPKSSLQRAFFRSSVARKHGIIDEEVEKEEVLGAWKFELITPEEEAIESIQSAIMAEKITDMLHSKKSELQRSDSVQEIKPKREQLQRVASELGDASFLQHLLSRRASVAKSKK